MFSFLRIQTSLGTECRPFPCGAIVIVLIVLMTATSGVMAQSGLRLQRRSAMLPSAGQYRVPHAAVVRVQAIDGRESSHGSGTLVGVQGDYALVVTNWHVVREGTERVSVTFPDGFHTPARVLRMDKDWDLAALVIWNPGNIKPVTIADSAPKPGDALTIAGYGSGQYRAAQGHCTQYVSPRINFPYEMLEVSVQARQGDSGGPIFNERNELAGVLFGASRGTTSGSYAGRVRQFLLTAWPNFGVPRDAMIATSPSKKRHASSYVASIERIPKPSKSITTTQKRYESKRPGRSNSLPVSVASQPKIPHRKPPSSSGTPLPRPMNDRVDLKAGQEIVWEDIVGYSPFQQAKTLFALIGVVVTLLHLVNFSPD